MRRAGHCRFCGMELDDSREFCSYWCKRDFDEVQADDEYDRRREDALINKEIDNE